MGNIYADYAATTPLDKRVLSRMMPYMTELFYNASSSHAGGLQAQQAILKARMEAARHIGSKMNEILFTSGATEAINLVLLGIARRREGSKRKKLVTVRTEHAAVLNTAEQCGRLGMDIVYLDVDTSALVDIQKDGKLPIDVDDIGIDLMAFSAHKIYGPKGVGALFRRSRSDVKIELEPISTTKHCCSNCRTFYAAKAAPAPRRTQRRRMYSPPWVGLTRKQTARCGFRLDCSPRMKKSAL